MSLFTLLDEAGAGAGSRVGAGAGAGARAGEGRGRAPAIIHFPRHIMSEHSAPQQRAGWRCARLIPTLQCDCHTSGWCTSVHCNSVHCSSVQ